MSQEKQAEKTSQVNSDAAKTKPTEFSVEDLEKVAGGGRNPGHATEQITVSWETHEIKV